MGISRRLIPIQSSYDCLTASYDWLHQVMMLVVSQLYSYVAQVRYASLGARTYAHLAVSRHGAICTHSLASKLADSLRLIMSPLGIV